MNSFYQGLAQHKFDHLHNRDDLWKLLVTITARKATAKRRAHFAQKRGGGQVRGESVFGSQDDEQRGLAHVLGTEPTPELAVSVAENCRQLLDQLQDETLRQIALWTLEGYRTEEIAAKLGCVRRTVERKLERIREIWSGNS
jgi:DNA-directed RNA polymerase specialized sigma24 family protein